MKKNKGYTLIEILTVLGIVAIIAAIVMPGLVNNVSESANGVKVARTVELFQNAMANLMSKAQSKSEDGTAFEDLMTIQVKDVFETVPSGVSGEAYLASGNNLFGVSGILLNTEAVNNYSVNSIKDYEGSDIEDENLLQSMHAYKFLRYAAVFLIQEIDVDDDVDKDDIITRVLIDANGTERPNRLGRDIFVFGLSNDGKLIPAGTKAYNDFDSNIAVGGCSAEPGDGTACTARLMADKWQIKY